MRLCFCLRRSLFHGEIRAVILALVLASLVKTRLKQTTLYLKSEDNNVRPQCNINSPPNCKCSPSLAATKKRFGAFASIPSRSVILRALQNFEGPFMTPAKNTGVDQRCTLSWKTMGTFIVRSEPCRNDLHHLRHEKRYFKGVCVCVCGGGVGWGGE